ncbi:class C sortase [Alkalibacillus almallahensis]|uniref:class C sortase n=1 Tax=Alkalibacillus almallahensis TaxID=1379154 RepID=UPI00141DE0B4|nr:class C sortase [Alkalibacillus almallahensis]NIK13174.1 sortase A [Alkalibacillus almallahensis]
MRKNWWLVIIFLIGLAVLLYPHVMQLINDEVAEAKVHEVQETWNELSKEGRTEIREEANEYNEEIKKRGRVGTDLENIDFTDSAQDSLTTGSNGTEDDWRDRGEEVNTSNAYAVIDVPRLNLRLPIYPDSNRWSLANGVGVVPGSSMPVGGADTHTVLAGHRGMATKVMFRHLDQLSIGDVFHIESISGRLTYRVVLTDVIRPNETESLGIQNGEDLATLVTCHPYGSNAFRLIVQGKRVNE